MPGSAVTKSDHAMYGAPVRWNSGLRAAFRSGLRIAAVAALLACLGSQILSASEPTVVGGPTIQRSMRVVPRRYVISPGSATIAADQTQRFGVVDANGNPVAVRWNISGLGCYGATCGSIDEQGVYRPPAMLPKPHIVTLEGVVASDPRYSVLTEIRLEAATTTVNPVAAGASSETPQLTAPQVPKAQTIASRMELIPVPGAVAATPAVRGAEDVRTAELLPLPDVVGAAPTIRSQRAARSSELPPVPSAVAAPPKIITGDGTRGSDVLHCLR